MSETMTEPGESRDWDVFISYSRADHRKAKTLLDALHECTTRSGRRPVVYLDVEGTRAGSDWRDFLEKALARSRHIVALYTRSYFSKDLCQWELHRALELNKPDGGRLIPLLYETEAEKLVPYVANGINWLPTDTPDWFERLRTVLDLRPAGPRRELRFESALTGALVNHTLPPQRVAIADSSGRPAGAAGDRVTVTAEPANAGLTGTLTVEAEQGAAVFTDLSFTSPATEVRLVATGPGCDPLISDPFPVRIPAPHAEVATGVDSAVLEVRGHPVFLPDGKTLAVLDEDRLTVYSGGREPVGQASLRQRPRLWARGSRELAVADWSGRVILASAEEGAVVADLDSPAGDRGPHVPGALAFDGDVLHVGMWDGRIWCLSGDGPPRELLTHAAGIQLLAFAGDSMLVGGLDGRLAVYQGGERVEAFELEPVLLGITCGPGFALVVGENKVYRLGLASSRLLAVELPVTNVTGTLTGALTTIVDDEGRGVSFDSELAVRTGFHTMPGARPVGADGDGRLLVFEHPDGSHVLMRDGRVGFTAAHPLAIASDGRTAALSDGSRITLLPPGELLTGEEPRHA